MEPMKVIVRATEHCRVSSADSDSQLGILLAMLILTVGELVGGTAEVKMLTQID